MNTDQEKKEKTPQEQTAPIEKRSIRSIIKDFGVDILKQGHQGTSEDEGEF